MKAITVAAVTASAQLNNVGYANSFSESTWPQNPAIRYPGATTSFGGLSATTSVAAPVYPNFGPWTPIAPSSELAVLTNSAPVPVTSITPAIAQVQPGTTTSFGGLTATTSFNSANASPVYTNNFGSYVPYGGDISWPFNKPWTPVAPSGEFAVLTNGATGPITPIAQVPISSGVPILPTIGAPASTLTAPTFAAQPAGLSNPIFTSSLSSAASFYPLQSLTTPALAPVLYSPSQPQFTPSQPRPVLNQWQSQSQSFGQGVQPQAFAQAPAQSSFALQSQTQLLPQVQPSLGQFQGSAFLGQSQPFGQAQNSFGQAQNSFGQAQNSFGQAQNSFGQAQNSFVPLPSFGVSQMSPLAASSFNAPAEEEGPTGMPLMLYN